MAMRGILRGLGVTGGATALADDERTGEVQAISMADGASRLQLLDEFEAGGIGWFWATDAQNRLIYLSPPAAETFEVSHDALIGQPLASLFTLETEDGEDVIGVMQLNGVRWQLVRLRLPDKQATNGAGSEPSASPEGRGPGDKETNSEMIRSSHVTSLFRFLA